MSDTPLTAHKGLPVFDRSTLIDDAATFYVKNKVYEGFKNIRLSRNLMSLTGNFEITLTDKWRAEEEDFSIRPGDRIHCHLGDNALFEGYVDTFEAELDSSSRSLSITGRDRTSDLVDCSVVGPSEYNNMDLEKLSNELLKPFGLKVIKNADVGKPFKKFTVRQGETVFEALNRAAQERKVLLLSSTHGNLVLEKLGSKLSSTTLIEGINILKVGASFDNTSRFSEYIVKGQGSGSVGSVDDSTGAIGKAYDKGIERYRPTIIIAENAVDNASAKERAKYESGFRLANSMKISVAVQGWRQEDGTLWSTNELVKITSGSVGVVDGTFLISRVKFEVGTSGTLTELELIRKDAFEFKEETKKEDDPLDLLGWDGKE